MKAHNMALHLTAKSAVSLRYTLLSASSELGVRFKKMGGHRGLYLYCGKEATTPISLPGVHGLCAVRWPMELDGTWCPHTAIPSSNPVTINAHRY